MIFLINYDRESGRLIDLVSFQDSQRETAENRRLDLEIENLAGQIVREVVLLEASTEALLRCTHRRYFESLEELKSSTDSMHVAA